MRAAARRDGIGWQVAAIGAGLVTIHENHEGSIMVLGLGTPAHVSDDALRDEKHPRERRPAPVQPDRSNPMQWTTPSATDFRFGFEITMYVAAR